jgi:hypothetical protein
LEAKAWSSIIASQKSPIATIGSHEHQEPFGDDKTNDAQMSEFCSQEQHSGMLMWNLSSPRHETVPPPYLSSLQPPPPPPPPPPFLAETFSEYQAEDIHNLQENLRDSRESLVGARARLHTKRRAVRDVRQQASTEIGAAFSFFKQYLLGLNTTLPSEIVDSLRNIDILQDKLGGEETDYDDAEEDYNRQEWNYTQLEETFMEVVPEGTMISRTPETHPESTSETDYLTQFADATNDTLYYSNLDELVQISLEASKLKMDQRNDMLTGTVELREPFKRNMPRGAKSYQDLTNLEARTQIPRSFSEVDLDSYRPDWSNIRDRINAWLLEGLRSSTLQQQHLRHVLAQQDLGNYDWFQTVTQYWFVDSSQVSLHCGDTTVPESTEDDHQSEGGRIPDHLFGDASEIRRRIGSPSGSRYDPAQYPLPTSSTLSDTSGRTGLKKPHDDHHPHDMTSPIYPDDPLPKSQFMQRESHPTTPTVDNTGPPTDQNEFQASPMERIDSAFPDSGKEIQCSISKRGDIKPQIPAQQSRQTATKASNQVWGLPLLRLTPASQSIQRLDSIPFVSTPDTRLRLPGPSAIRYFVS